jgi:hypothetical protein
MNEEGKLDIFMDVAKDILTSTMANLMEEATFEEFAIFAEPLRFLTRFEAQDDRSVV